MTIGVLGTGMVGQTIGSKLVERGHQVMMGSRSAGNDKAATWANTAGNGASAGTFADAAAFGEVLFNCTSGAASLDALTQAGADNLRGKILVDIANPLDMSAADWSKGIPPTLLPQYINTTSLAEEIQKAFPETKVVKTLNTINHNIMVNADLLPQPHDLFVSGNDTDAKQTVIGIMKADFGWQNVLDLGGIRTARATEMILPLWLALWGSLKNPNINLHVVQG